MGDRSKIEWTEASWTPIRARRKLIWSTPRHPDGYATGWHCEHVSEGCRNCYAEAMNRRLGTGFDFKPGHRDDIEIFLDEKMLLQPLHWKKPRMIFVCSMTDLFADFVSDEMIDKVFAVMALCPQHTFQVLTKRPARIWKYITAGDRRQCWFNQIVVTGSLLECHNITRLRAAAIAATYDAVLPNVWLGTSCEDQPTADARIPDLLATPAAVRFISGEPLLGPIAWLPSWDKLDWVIVGGESGLHARPMHPQWARDIRDQCAAAGVPFFFKQWGAFVPAMISRADFEKPKPTHVGEMIVEDRGPFIMIMRRIGKKAAGRLLDGIEHNAFPEART